MKLTLRSPYSLLQEDVYPDEWRVLIVCMMLNCTPRRQVERILPTFFNKWPSADKFVGADDNDVIDVCRSLGFANRRTKNMKMMSSAYVLGNWNHASELPGIGDYGARCWEMICRGRLGDDPPNDHALVRYYHWAREQDGNQKKTI